MMSEAEPERSRFGGPQDAEVTQYRVVSGLAVTALILALFTPVALAHPALWIVPAAGIVVSLVALKRIAAAAPTLIGRKAAIAGLVLSVLCAAIACSQWFTFRSLIDREAHQFAEYWFMSLRNGEPHKAHQLSEYPESRLAIDENLWEHYASGTDSRRKLESYLRRSEIESLLALGDQAKVRYYDTERIYRDQGDDTVVQVYAVTSREGGEKTSYFIRLIMKRRSLPETGRTYWQLFDFAGGIRPAAMGSEEASQEG
jgi:hypothetical protein